MVEVATGGAGGEATEQVSARPPPPRGSPAPRGMRHVVRRCASLWAWGEPRVTQRPLASFSKQPATWTITRCDKLRLHVRLQCCGLFLKLPIGEFVHRAT